MSGNAGAIVFTPAAGIAAAVQTAVNAALGRRIGTLEAAAFQSVVAALLFALVLLAAARGVRGHRPLRPVRVSIGSPSPGLACWASRCSR